MLKDLILTIKDAFGIDELFIVDKNIQKEEYYTLSLQNSSRFLQVPRHLGNTSAFHVKRLVESAYTCEKERLRNKRAHTVLKEIIEKILDLSDKPVTFTEITRDSFSFVGDGVDIAVYINGDLVFNHGLDEHLLNISLERLKTTSEFSAFLKEGEHLGFNVDNFKLIVVSRQPIPSFIKWALRVKLGWLNRIYQGNLVYREKIQAIEAAEAFEESQKKYQQLVDDMGEQFVVFSHKGLSGELTYVSEGITSVFGLAKEEVLGRPWGSQINWIQDDAEIGQRYADRLVNGEIDSVSHEMRFIHLDGNERTLRVASHAVRNKSGELISVDGILEDYTRQKQIEKQLVTAQQQAEAANRAKSAFLANMSHEIRTPMNSIIGNTYLALDNTPDEETRFHLEMIAGSSENLLGLINDILDFSKIEAGELSIEHRPFDLHDVVTECIKAIEALITGRKKELELTYVIAPDVSPVVTGDPLRLRQILLNLLSNGIKFTEKGSVDLLVDCLLSADGLQRLQFHVRDTGPGIALDKQLHIFDKFAQEDTSTTRRYGGTGLGLAICRQLSHLMGGDINIFSSPEQGSAFIVTLPFQPCSVEDIPAKEEAIRPEQAAVRPLSLLLVEDNQANRILAKMILEKREHLVTEAHHGLDALSLLVDRDFDAVLMDVQMPVLNGLTTTKIIRNAESGEPIEDVEQGLAGKLSAHLSGRHIPVIAMTANAMSGDREECLGAGMDDYLTKPIVPDSLTAVLSKVANGRFGS